jgi:hypothetical protein
MQAHLPPAASGGPAVRYPVAMPLRPRRRGLRFSFIIVGYE